jgi:thiol-disulfide isomerase/thioredoxin
MNTKPNEFKMKTSTWKWPALALALTAGASLIAPAAEPTLKAGDPAPKLQTGKFVQGDPVTGFNKGTAYIVEFWATWCGPCRQSIPHLNEKYEKYKDKGLVVIGQDCWEDDDGLVAPFVKKMGDQMTYRVALDDKSDGGKGKMAETWMAAAGQDGIPTAFLIDTNGIIAWIGHPMSLKEEVIDQVLAGKFDVQKAADEAAEQKKNEAQIQKLAMAMQMAMQAKDWDTASAKLDEIGKLLPAEEQGSLDTVRFGISLGKKDYPAAYKLAQQLSDAHKDDAQLQNQLAWEIVADPTIEQRDLNLAHTFATRANTASDGKEPAVLDTLARVLFMQGKQDEAVAMETKALNLAEDNQKAPYQTTLDSYKKGELPKVGEGGIQ